MRLSNLIITAPLLTAVLGAPANHPQNHHQHDKQKREVIAPAILFTEQKDDGSPLVVEADQFGLEDSAVRAVTTSSSISTVTTTTLQPQTEQVEATTQENDSGAVTTTISSAVKETSAAVSSASSSTSTSSSSFGAGAKGISYSPYTNSGGCKSQSEVASDLEALQDFSIIRLYGVDCSQVENVLQAKGTNQKLFLGIYYMDQIAEGVATISSAVSSYGSWDDIYTISIGNELVNSGSATVSQVGSYVSTGRTALTAAGYTGKVVAVDTFIAVINNPGLCEFSDYMAVNAHAYFDYYTVAEDAGSWVLKQIQNVYSACDGKKNVLISESGWPSQGDTYGVAVPSKANQELAIASIKESCGTDTFLFSAYNDYWKNPGIHKVEQYWGIFSSE